MRRWLQVLPLLLATVASAKVFWRTPVDLADSWNLAYSTTVRINHTKGDLNVYSTSGTLREIEALLRDRHGDRLAWIPGEVSAWALARRDGMRYRYLVQPLPDGGYWISCLQRPAETEEARPARHRLKDIPSFPQSDPTFYSLDEGNQVAIEISTTPASPAAALDLLSGMMETEGWTPSPLNTGGMRMFLRGNRVALLGAQRGSDGITRVLRLHKPLGVK